MAFIISNDVSTDNAPTGPSMGKPMNPHIWDHVLVIYNLQAAPAPFNVQTPPKTTGRPI